MSITEILDKTNSNNQNLNPGIEEKKLSQWLTQNNLPAMNIDMNEYLKLLALTKIAAKSEQNTLGQKEQENIAINNAYKLTLLFGDFSSALNYLKRYENQNNTERQLVHDACLFSIPKNNLWNLKLWRSLIKKNPPNQPSDLIMRLLPFASKIEEYVLKHQESLEAKLKEDVKNDYKIKFSKEYDEMLKQADAVSNNNNNVNNLQKSDYVDQAMEKHRNEIYKVFVSKKQNILSQYTDLKSIFNYARQAFFDRASENVEAAELFFQYGLTEDAFNCYLSMTPKDDATEIPDIVVLGSDIASDYKRYYIKKLKSTDPRAAVLGKLTSCCQSLGDVGETSVVQGITRSDNGFYVICEMKGNEPSNTDKIVSQCWAWRSRNQAIVFDSVESQVDFKRNNEILITDLFTELSYRLVEHGVPKVLVGIGGETPEKLGTLVPLTFEAPKVGCVYTDAVSQRLLADVQFLDLMHNVFVQKNKKTLLKNRKVTQSQYTKNAMLTWIDLFIRNGFGNSKAPRFNIAAADLFDRRSLMHSWQDLVTNASEIDEEKLWSEIKNLVKQEFNINLTQQKFNVNLDQMEHQSLLFSMVNLKQLDIVEYLLNHGADINITNEYGQNCLHLACEMGDENLVKLLLRYGADPLMQDRKTGESPLFLCCSLGQLNLLDIVASNLSIDGIRNNMGETLMHVACQYEHIDIIEYLHARGLTFDTLSKEMEYPLDYPIKQGSLELLNCVQSLGVDLRKYDSDIIKSAIRNSLVYISESEIEDDPSLLALLQDFGINPKLPDSNGDYPILLACQYKATYALKYLVEHGCSLDIANKEGKGPLHVACATGHIPTAFYLLEQGMDVNSRDVQGATPLHILCSSSEVIGASQEVSTDSLFKLFLQKADPDALDHKNQTPLHYACKSANLEAVAYLLKGRYDVNARDKDGKTPIFHAIAQVMSDERAGLLKGDRRDDFFKMSYARLNDVDKPIKASFEAKKIIFTLIQNGALLDIKDDNDVSALALIKQTDNKEIIDFVENYLKPDTSTIANSHHATLFKTPSPESNLTERPNTPQNLQDDGNSNNNNGGPSP